MVLGVSHKNEKSRFQEAEVEQKLYDRILREINRCLKKDASHLIFQIGMKVIIFFHSLLSRGGPGFLHNKEGEKMAYVETHSQSLAGWLLASRSRQILLPVIFFILSSNLKS